MYNNNREECIRLPCACLGEVVLVLAFHLQNCWCWCVGSREVALVSISSLFKYLLFLID